MSESVLNQGFFNDPSIQRSAKLGACALLLKGTYEKNYKREYGNVSTFVSNVGEKGKLFPIMFDIGVESSAAKNNVMSLAKLLSTEDCDVARIVEGKFTDEQVLDMFAGACADRYRINSAGLKDIAGGIKENLDDYFTTLAEFDGSTYTPAVIDVCKGLANDVVTRYSEFDKKKINSTEKQVEEMIAPESI